MHNIEAPLANEYYHNFRHTETAIIIRDFFLNGWRPFSYSIPVRGDISYILFEFPIYQSIVYFMMKFLGVTDIDFYSRIVRISSFYFSAFALMLLIRKITDNFELACVSGIAYVVSMYNIYWSRGCFIDYMSVLFGLLYVYYLLLWEEQHTYKVFVCGLLFGLSAYLLKSTSMFPCILFYGFISLEKVCGYVKGRPSIVIGLKGYVSHNFRVAIPLFFMVVIPVLVCAAWNQHADNMKDLSVYTATFDSTHLKNWNFGTLEQKLSWAHWSIILHRFVLFYGGYLPFILLLLLYYKFTRKKYLKYVLYALLAVFLTWIILFNLYYVHNYYLIGVSAFAYMVFGIFIYELLVDCKRRQHYWQLMILLPLLVLQFTNNSDYYKGVFDVSVQNTNIGTFVSEIMHSDEKLLISGEAWNPTTMYYSGRCGFMIRGGEDNLFTDNEFVENLKRSNYTTLLVHNTDTIELASNSFPNMMQYLFDLNGRYSSENEIFIYKFLDTGVTKEMKHEISINGEGIYLVEGDLGSVARLEHNYEKFRDVNIFIMDDNLLIHRVHVNLLSNSRGNWINLEKVCANPRAIICKDKDLKLKIMY